MGLLSLVGTVGASASVASSGFLAYTNISNKARRRREEEEESAKFELRRKKAEDKAAASVFANIRERDEVRKIEGSIGQEENVDILASKWVAFLNRTASGCDLSALLAGGAADTNLRDEARAWITTHRTDAPAVNDRQPGT